MNKKLLSVIALVVQIVSIFLLFIDGTFIWYCHNHYENISIQEHSFNWLFDDQFNMSIFVFVIIALIILNIIVQIISLFKEPTFLKNKFMLILPVITLVTFVILCLWGNAYSDSFTYNGELRYCSVGLGMIFYVETVLIGISILIECLKHFVKAPYKE